MISGYKPGIWLPYYGYEDSSVVVLWNVLVIVPSFIATSVCLVGPRGEVEVQKR